MLRDYSWEEIAEYLQKIRGRAAPLSEILDFHEKVLRRQYQAAAHPDVSGLSQKEREGRNRRGQPVAERREFTVDFASAESLFRALLDLVRERKGEVAEEAAELAALLQSERYRFPSLFEEGLQGEGDVTPLLGFLVRESLRPSVEACAAALGRLVEPDHWFQKICPVCGSAPRLAEVTKGEWTAHRTLHCSFCSWRWPYLRVGCPFCSTTDHRVLDILSVEEEQRCRLSLCTLCHRYIKEVDNKEFIGLIPFLEDLATPHLDLLAEERGYTRGGDHATIAV